MVILFVLGAAGLLAGFIYLTLEGDKEYHERQRRIQHAQFMLEHTQSEATRDFYAAQLQRDLEARRRADAPSERIRDWAVLDGLDGDFDGDIDF